MPPVPPGLFFSLSRDDAKTLFVCKNAEDVRQLIAGLKARPANEENGCDVGPAWETLHRCLSEGNTPPLNQAVLGGRAMDKGYAGTVNLVRPDIVPHIADALAALSEAELQARFDRHSPESANFAYTWSRLTALRDFYRRAATAGDAILFVVEEPE